jgi:RNA recognition motif-containing protein
VVMTCLQVFCGKIPKDVLEDELIPLFEQCGTIWDLRLMMDPATKQCRSFAFVTFVDKSSVDAAVKQVS